MYERKPRGPLLHGVLKRVGRRLVARANTGAALALAALLLGFSLLAPPSASAASCRAVSAGGEMATSVRSFNLGCTAVRRNLVRWMRTRFPKNRFGWYCDLSGERKLCSGGNGGGAPYFTFRLRR